MDRIKHNYDAIDLAKFVCCLFIVGIHTEAFSDLIGGGYYYLQNCIYKLAVPFFFVASGFFFGKKVVHSELKTSLLQYIKRLVIPLIFWEAVNIVIEILKQMFIQDVPTNVIVRNVIQSILFYPYGSLWYVQALIVALLLIAVALKNNRLNFCIIIGFFLYLIGLLGNTYFFCIEGTMFQEVVEIYLNIFVSSRNGLFVGLFFVAIGVKIAENIERLSNNKLLCMVLIVTYVVFAAEVCLTKELNSADDKSLYLTFVVLIPTLFICIAKISVCIKKARLLRALSTGIYFMHKAMIHVWLVIALELNLLLYPTIEFILVVLSCVLMCFVAYKIDNKNLNFLVK